MSEQIKRREPGERAFPSRPKLVLVPSRQRPNRLDVKTEMSPEVKEMLREMNRRHVAAQTTDTPDAA